MGFGLQVSRNETLATCVTLRSGVEQRPWTLDLASKIREEEEERERERKEEKRGRRRRDREEGEGEYLR